MKSVPIEQDRLLNLIKVCVTVLIFTLIFPSCDGIEDVPLGTITVVIDGKTRSFSTESKAEWMTVENGYGLTLTGNKGEPGSSNNLHLTIASPQPLQVMTYRSNQSGNAVVINYNVCLYLFWDEYVSSSAVISVTELDDNHVKGTFSGTVVNGEAIKKLTGGVFNVSF